MVTPDTIDIMARTLTRHTERRALLTEELEATKVLANKWGRRAEKSKLARIAIQTIAQQTQKNVEKRISSLISLALQAVIYDKSYSFEVEFVQRRNRTECDLYLVENGVRINPMNATGGGCIDIVKFAAAVAFSTFKPSRRIFIADEPFRNLSEKYHTAASKMMKMLSETKDKSGRQIMEQFVIISHMEKINNSADNLIDIAEVKKEASQKAKKSMGFRRD